MKSDDDKETYRVYLFELSIARLHFLWAMAQKFNIVLPDFLRKHPGRFKHVMEAPSTIILAVNNVGIVYATDLVPGDSAIIYYFFWDKGQKNRQRLLLSCMSWLCVRFQLHRLTCIVPRFATAAIYRVHKMGFRLEGVMKEAMMHNGRRADCYVFGVLKSELTEEAVEIGKLQRTKLESEWYNVFRDDPLLLHKVLRRS